MARRYGRFAIAAALFTAPLLPSGCETGGLVGGDCREGFTNCDGQCLDTRSDALNCGSCGRRCDPGVSCVNGTCGGGSGGAGGNDAGDATSDAGGRSYAVGW